MSDTFSNIVEAINAKDHRIAMLERRIAELEATTGIHNDPDVMRGLVAGFSQRKELNEENQRLLESLVVAKSTLDVYAKRENWVNGLDTRCYDVWLPTDHGYEPAVDALAEMKRIEGTPAASDAKGKDGQQDAE